MGVFVCFCLLCNMKAFVFVFVVFCLFALFNACNSNSDCASDEYCERDFNCNGQGVCTTTPQACVEIFAPQCGCDGNTYENDCFAHTVRVSISAAGGCGSDDIFTTLSPLSPSARSAANDDDDDDSNSSNDDDDDDSSNSLGSRLAWAGAAVVLFLAFL